MHRFLLIAALMSAATPARPAEEPGRIIGVGGIFFKAKDPEALAAWYRDVLGIPIESWGGAILNKAEADHAPYLVWSAFKADTDYFKPSDSGYMINYAVDDLDAYVKKLEAKGVTILSRDAGDANGKFAWILDPEGRKIELWEPPAE